MGQLHIRLSGKRCVYCQQICDAGEAIIAVLGSEKYTGRTEVLNSLFQGNRTRNSSQSTLSNAIGLSGARSVYDQVATRAKEGASLQIFEVATLGSSPTAEDRWLWDKRADREATLLTRGIVWHNYVGDGTILYIFQDRSNFTAQHGLAGRLEAQTAGDRGRLHAGQIVYIYAIEFLGIQYQPFLERQPVIDQAIMRLGVDDFGIRTVEIMEVHLLKNEPRSGKCPWYIVERLQRTRSLFNIESSGPFLRMISRGHEEVQLWNVMNPPERGTYSSTGRHPKPLHRTRCIQMRGATGLTVFCDTRSIYGIYAHRTNDSAISTYRTLYYHSQNNAMWRYFPLSPGEVITSAWTRNNPGIFEGTSLVICTSRSRLCFFGAVQDEEEIPFFALCDAPMRHLLYDDPDSANPISWFGATPQISSSPYLDLKGFQKYPHLHHTQAALTNLVQAEIYSNEHGASTGAILKYLDGSSECIGQRRFGMSKTKITKVHHPDQIHFRSFEIGTLDHRTIPVRCLCVEVRFSSGNPELPLGGWQSQDMIGHVTWSFTKWEDNIQLSTEPLIK